MARYPVDLNGKWRYYWRRYGTYAVPGLLFLAVLIVLLYGRLPLGNNQTIPLEAPSETDSAYRNEQTETQNQPPQPAPVLAVEMPRKSESTDTSTMPEVASLNSEDVSNPEVTTLVADVIAILNANPSKVIEARDRLNSILQMPMAEQQKTFIKDKLSELADKWLFSSTVFPNDMLCDTYLIKPGDQLRIIAERFKVPYQILMQINKIRSPEALQAGSTIKVINGPFHAKVYRSKFEMDLYLQNTFVRSFSVGLGKPGMETPTGLWIVRPGGKLVKPVWSDPVTGRTYRPEDPDYPLGSRWIALDGIEGSAKGRTGFAIHGTKEPEQIGMAGSQGCIRLHNGDAILVYNLLEPAHSKVQVVE
jgi:hypothetical protein